MGAVLEPLPADPAVAAGQAAGGEVEQQAAEQALVAVAQEVAQMGAERLAVPQRMVALDPLVELRDALRLADELQPQGRQVGQRCADGRSGGGARPGPDRFLRAASGAALGGQGEDAEPLELGEQALGGGQAVVGPWVSASPDARRWCARARRGSARGRGGRFPECSRSAGGSSGCRRRWWT